MPGQHKLLQRHRLFCQFPRTGSAWSTKTLTEGLKFLFRPATAQPLNRIFRDANRWFPERNWELSRALVADGSFSCPATKKREWARSQICKCSPQWGWCMGTVRAAPHWTASTAPGGTCPVPPQLVFWQLSLPHTHGPLPQLLKSICTAAWKEPNSHRLAVP